MVRVEGFSAALTSNPSLYNWQAKLSRASSKLFLGDLISALDFLFVVTEMLVLLCLRRVDLLRWPLLAYGQLPKFWLGELMDVPSPSSGSLFQLGHADGRNVYTR